MPPTPSQYSQLKKELADLDAKLDKFLQQYELDMRGDKDIEEGGRAGLIGAIREVRKYIKEYPSLTYLLSKKPFSTVAVGIGVWLALATLYEFGILKIIAGMFGISTP